MRTILIVAALAVGALAGRGLAQTPGAGTPLAPSDAPGPWTLESQGHAICVVSLQNRHAGANAFALNIPAACADALPSGVAGWAPSSDGVKLVGPGGVTLIDFGRWSDSLLVAHAASGRDLQLQRGGPNS